MLTVESYKLGQDSEEDTMTSQSESSVVMNASERMDLQTHNQIPPRSSPADHLMHAWSFDAEDWQEKDTAVATQRDACPPEVYLG